MCDEKGTLIIRSICQDFSCASWAAKLLFATKAISILLSQICKFLFTFKNLLNFKNPLGQLGSAVPAVSPPNSLCPPPASSLVGWGEKQKNPWLCVSPAQQQLKHPCVINTVFSTNPKHSPIQATVKKINSIPAKTGIQSTKQIIKAASILVHAL